MARNGRVIKEWTESDYPHFSSEMGLVPTIYDVLWLFYFIVRGETFLKQGTGLSHNISCRCTASACDRIG